MTHEFSFVNGTLDREYLADYIMTTNLPIKYTYGYISKNPKICKKPISKDEAITILNEESYVDVTVTKKYIHINAYSANDMW